MNKGFDKSVSDENGGIPSSPVYNDEKGQESRYAKVFWLTVAAFVDVVFVLFYILVNVIFQDKIFQTSPIEALDFVCVFLRMKSFCMSWLRVSVLHIVGIVFSKLKN